MTNAPPPTDCTCLTLRDQLRAQMEGRDISTPCPAHEPTAHAQHEADAAVTEARARRDLLLEDETTEAEPDPFAEALARAVPPRPSNVTPLNAPPSAHPSLAGWKPTNNPDGPSAA